MNLFSVNQVNQVYVASNTAANITSGSSALAADLGSVYCGVIKDMYDKPESIYFKHRGKGGVTRTDIIDIKRIMYFTATKGSDLSTTLNQVILRLSNDVINNNVVLPGYDYTIRIKLNHYIGISPEDAQYWKYGMVHTGPNMSVADFWKAMAKSILRNMSREAVKFIKIYTVTGATSGNPTVTSTEVTFDNVDTSSTWTSVTGIAIREVEPSYILGLKQQKIMSVQVTPIPIEVEGELTYWVHGQSEDTPVKATPSTEKIVNSKMAADYEYFFHGERGDQYRFVGWPDYIPTEYMANPNAQYGYDFIQLHYYYVGSNEGSQKSEKDLTFLVERTSTDQTSGSNSTPGLSASASAIGEFIAQFLSNDKGSSSSQASNSDPD